jgi:DNA-binding MarR family transcriptional regulator
MGKQENSAPSGGDNVRPWGIKLIPRRDAKRLLELNAGELCTMIALEEFARDKDRCFPRNRTIAEMLGMDTSAPKAMECSLRSVKNWLKGLEKKKWIRREKSPERRERDQIILLRRLNANLDGQTTGEKVFPGRDATRETSFPETGEKVFPATRERSFPQKKNKEEEEPKVKKSSDLTRHDLTGPEDEISSRKKTRKKASPKPDPSDPTLEPFTEEDYDRVTSAIFETFDDGNMLNAITEFKETEDPAGGLRGNPRLLLDAIYQIDIQRKTPGARPVRKAWEAILTTWRKFEAGEKPWDETLKRTDRFLAIKQMMNREWFLKWSKSSLDSEIKQGFDANTIVLKVMIRVANLNRELRLSDSQKAIHERWVREEVEHRLETARRPV